MSGPLLSVLETVSLLSLIHPFVVFFLGGGGCHCVFEFVDSVAHTRLDLGCTVISARSCRDQSCNDSIQKRE